MTLFASLNHKFLERNFIASKSPIHCRDEKGRHVFEDSDHD